MKKLLLEFAFYFAIISVFLAWRDRERMRRMIVHFEAELQSATANQRAIEASLRSIRRLPETDA